MKESLYKVQRAGGSVTYVGWDALPSLWDLGEGVVDGGHVGDH
jgi:hypothetical protein